MSARKARALPEPATELPPEYVRAIADGMPHMLWTARADGALEFLNQRIVDYTGMSRGALATGGWVQSLHPEEAAEAQARWQRAVATGRGFESEIRLRRADGRYRWHRQAVLPLRDPAGRVVLWHGTCTDVDERKRAALRLERARLALESVLAARTQALEASGERLRAFLDSMPAIAWIKDSRLRYVWVSASYERVLGKTLAQLKGRENSEVWPAELALKSRRDDERVLRVNGPVQAISYTPRADGSIARLLIVKFPFPDDSGATGVAALAFDLGAQQGEEREPVGVAEERFERLSGRERQVLRLIVDGLTSVEVGAQLGISPKSVDTYRSRLMAKLGIADLPALVKFALRFGLTTDR